MTTNDPTKERSANIKQIIHQKETVIVILKLCEGSSKFGNPDFSKKWLELRGPCTTQFSKGHPRLYW